MKLFLMSALFVFVLTAVVRILFYFYRTIPPKHKDDKPGEGPVGTEYPPNLKQPDLSEIIQRQNPTI